RPGLRKVLGIELVELGDPPQDTIVGLKAVRVLTQRSPELRLADLRSERADDSRRDLVLQRKQGVCDAVEMTGPYDRPVRRLRKFHGDPHPRTGAPHAAREYIGRTDGAPDDADVHVGATIAKRRTPRDDK